MKRFALIAMNFSLSYRTWLYRVVPILLLVATEQVHGLYRGDEFEPRDYRIGSAYFINRASYRPRSEFVDRFNASTNAYIGAAGSISSSDLYLYQRLKLSQPMGESFRFRLDYLQDRDFDGKFRHFSLGLQYRLNAHWSVEVLGEPTPDKDQADIGGALLFQDDRLYVRMQGVWPSFVFDDKNPDGATMDRHAPNLQLVTRGLVGSSWEVWARSDFDFPRRLTNPAESFEFSFEKYEAEGGIRWHTTETGHLDLAVEGEWSEKERTGLEAGDAADFSVERQYLMLSLEFWQRLRRETSYRAGAHYVLFDEDRDFPHNPGEILYTDRQDRIVYLGRIWNLRDGLQLNTRVLANVLQDRRVVDEERRNSSSTDFQLRSANSLIFHGPDYQVEIGAAVDLDRRRFGGGFVKALIDF